MPQRPGRSADPTQYTPFFCLVRRQLHCEGVPLEAIAARVGTPAYVYSRASIERSYRALDGALAALPHTICYAVKANSNLEILRVLARQGSSFDIVSSGELYRLRCIRVPGRRIVFSGVGKSREEIREALAARILLFNVESAAELALLVEESARAIRKDGAKPAVAIRVNPDVEAGGHPHISTGHHRHKFGVDWAEARQLYLAYRDSRWIAWQGLSAHIGSQILSLAPFLRALRRLASYVRDLGRNGVPLRYFDFGGGLGVRYSAEHPPQIAAYGREIARVVRPLGCRLLLEPGRVLVGAAGVLLTRVLYTKRNRGKDFVVVDAAMNDFLRPALYGATHPVTPVAQPQRSARRARADVVGPVCETGDFFVQDWPLPQVGAGDLLVLWGTGAYGFVASSNYNSRPRAAEVLVEGNRFRIIRRRESHADLVRGE